MDPETETQEAVEETTDAPAGLLDAVKDDGEGEKKPNGETTETVETKETTEAEPSAPERPSWLTEDKFWDPKKGLNGELLFKNYGEMMQQFGRKEHKAPKTAEDYRSPFDDEKSAELLMVKGDPVFDWLAKTAHEHNLPQATFGAILKGVAELGEQYAEKPIDPAAEMTKLGEGGKAMASWLFNWGKEAVDNGVFNDDDWTEWQIACGTAEGARMMRKVLERTTGDSMIPRADDPQLDGLELPSDEELNKLVADERYGTDEQFTKDVDRKFERRYGSHAAGSSVVRRPS